jgi:hypothetical protein
MNSNDRLSLHPFSPIKNQHHPAGRSLPAESRFEFLPGLKIDITTER